MFFREQGASISYAGRRHTDTKPLLLEAPEHHVDGRSDCVPRRGTPTPLFGVPNRRSSHSPGYRIVGKQEVGPKRRSGKLVPWSPHSVKLTNALRANPRKRPRLILPPKTGCGIRPPRETKGYGRRPAQAVSDRW